MQRMVFRDRNHPCIIMWSLSSESGTGGTMTRCTTDEEADPTRLVQYESCGGRHRRSAPCTGTASGSKLNELDYQVAAEKNPGRAAGRGACKGCEARDTLRVLSRHGEFLRQSPRVLGALRRRTCPTSRAASSGTGLTGLLLPPPAGDQVGIVVRLGHGGFVEGGSVFRQAIPAYKPWGYGGDFGERYTVLRLTSMESSFPTEHRTRRPECKAVQAQSTADTASVSQDGSFIDSHVHIANRFHYVYLDESLSWHWHVEEDGIQWRQGRDGPASAGGAGKRPNSFFDESTSARHPRLRRTSGCHFCHRGRPGWAPAGHVIATFSLDLRLLAPESGKTEHRGADGATKSAHESGAPYRRPPPKTSRTFVWWRSRRPEEDGSFVGRPMRQQWTRKRGSCAA